MEPREFICNVYGYEWDKYFDPATETWKYIVGQGQSFSDCVDAMITRIEDCGFTAVAVNEQPVWNQSGEWDFFTNREISGPGDTILTRLTDSGLKILLRVWALVRTDQLAHIAEAYSPNCAGPRRDGHYCLNTYEPKSAELLSDMGEALVQAGIYDCANWVIVGWDDTGEVDDIRNFTPPGLLNQRLRPVREGAQQIVRASAGERQPAPARTVRIHDANEAIEIMYSAIRRKLGDSKPIGCMRGSQWHAQPVRRNVPQAIGETAGQSNDANQLSDGACQNYGFRTPYLQRDALRFSCDLLRGMDLQFASVEADGFYNPGAVPPSVMSTMVPPDPPRPYDATTKEPWATEIRQRARICFERGLSFQMTHFDYRALGVWNTPSGPVDDATLSAIAALRSTPLLDVHGTPVEGAYAAPAAAGLPPLPDMPETVSRWRAIFTAQQAEPDSLVVPVVFPR